MPVIYKPIDSGFDRLEGRCIAFCTNMGVAIDGSRPESAAEAWHVPEFRHPNSHDYIPLNRDELRKFPWHCPSTVHRTFRGLIYLDFKDRVVSINTPGVDPVNRIIMTSFTDTNVKSLQARIRRRLVYDQRVQRCTAAAMVLHRRLGDCSAMHMLGSEIMGLIAFYV